MIQQTIYFFAFFLITQLSAINTQEIDAYLSAQQDFHGGVLIAQKDFGILFKRAYGLANYEFDIKNTSHTKFLIASNTKTFTATAILLLQEKKLLSVNDTVSKYIPDYPQGDCITIHHLLTHSSGIPNYYQYWDSIKDSQNLQEMVNTFKKWDLEFETGSAYSYSNSAYSILAYIIEKATGQSYEQFMQEHIFKPLQMNNTGSYSRGPLIKNKACGYCIENEKMMPTFIHNPITLLGNGDLFSSLEDMSIFYNALFTGKIISQKSLELMHAKHILMQNSTRAHGYGWFIDEKNLKTLVEYSGCLRGFLSKVIHCINNGITIIILTNKENFEQFDEICTKLTKWATEV